MVWLDWRYNIDIKIGVSRARDGSTIIPTAHVKPWLKFPTIFIGTAYLEMIVNEQITVGEDWYEHIPSLVALIIHETIHIVLAKKIDRYDDWGDKPAFFALHGFDAVDKKHVCSAPDLYDPPIQMEVSR